MIALVSDLLLLGLVTAVVPAVIVILNGWQLRRTQAESWAREDKVAARVEAVALASTETARLLVEADRRRTVEAATLDAKVGMIHALVNSNLTTEMKGRLVALRGQVVLMERVDTLLRQQGSVPTEDEDDAVAGVKSQVAELEAQLAMRFVQQDSLDRRAKP